MEIQEIYGMVTRYQGNNNFMLSLQSQLTVKGMLSVKQLDCAGRFFNVVPVLPSVAPTAPAYSLNRGDKITIRKWLANALGKEKGLHIFFRNLIVEEVVAETHKAVLVKVSFNSKLATCCHICGLNLDTEISKATGIGPVCAKRLGFKRVTLADSAAILAKIEEEAKIAGVIGPIWIPKGQLVTKAEQILFEDK